MRLSIFSILFCLSSSLLFAQNESVKGYVTVEPFETRIEALCLPRAYEGEWGLPKNLSGNVKTQVLNRVLSNLKVKTRIQSPDYEFNFDTTHARFVLLDKDLGYVSDDRASIPLEEAIIGVSMSSLSAGIDDLEVGWDWYAPGDIRTPVQVTVGDDIVARFLTPEEPFMRWRRRAADKVNATPKLQPLPAVTTVKRGHQPILMRVAIGILALTGLIVMIMKTKTPPLVFFLIPLGIVALIGAFRFSREVPELPKVDTEANDLVYRMLRNTYHSFDFRDEEDIYEVLKETIEGQLLEDIYLEVLKGLELENSGGPRVRITLIDLRECDIIARNDDAGTFDVQSEWVAVGNVHHWGHTHQRDNRYKAIIKIGAFEETWKITKMRILDEERTQVVKPTKLPGE